jgi:hypothetical protein
MRTLPGSNRPETLVAVTFGAVRGLVGQFDAPINSDNRRYMTVKAARAEHRLDHLMASLADQS